MKNLILILVTLFQVSTAVAAGYEPTVLENETQLASVFKKMDYDFKMIRPWKLQFGSECTKRAETWAYDLSKTQNINSQKVFVFYTQAYHNYYRKAFNKKFIWWFHVSPFVLVKTDAGKVEERVIDKTFSDQPQTMKEWTDIFIKSKEACIENVPYKNFEGDITGTGASYNANAHCYIVRAPMYDMFPGDIDAREQGQQSKLEWNMDQVVFASKALTNGARKDYVKRTGLKD